VAGETVQVREMTWQETLHAIPNPMEKSMHTAERRTLALFSTTTARATTSPKVVLAEMCSE
jgi:hypothetical protein